MFCGSCYQKNFGPKGYGFGGGSGTLSMDDGKGYTVSTLPPYYQIQNYDVLIVFIERQVVVYN